MLSQWLTGYRAAATSSGRAAARQPRRRGGGLATVTQAAARQFSGCAHVVVGPAMLAGALARQRVIGLQAQWVIVPNVTEDDQIVSHRMPPAGVVAEIMRPPPS